MKVDEAAVLGSSLPSLIILTVSMDVKRHLKKKCYPSQQVSTPSLAVADSQTV